MKAKEVKTIKDLKIYLKQIGADIFVVADYPERNSFECTVYDKNSKKCRVKIHIHDLHLRNGNIEEYWYINGFKEDGSFWKFDRDICFDKEAICKTCWRLSRKKRVT